MVVVFHISQMVRMAPRDAVFHGVHSRRFFEFTPRYTHAGHLQKKQNAIKDILVFPFFHMHRIMAWMIVRNERKLELGTVYTSVLSESVDILANKPIIGRCFKLLSSSER